jgi:hypothetical protein
LLVPSAVPTHALPASRSPPRSKYSLPATEPPEKLQKMLQGIKTAKPQDTKPNGMSGERNGKLFFILST